MSESRFDDEVLDQLFDRFERKLTPYLNSGHRDENMQVLDALETTIARAYSHGLLDGKDRGW